jgi:peptide/nickel transport system permease protein
LGIYAAYKKDQKFDRISSVLVFMLYSLPGYFVGTILLYWFANPDNFVWFPIGGVKDASIYQENWSVFQKISHQAPYFVLPLITYTYSSFAFISRMIRGSMVEVLQQDYIRTARAKGLSEKRVILVHALRNSLLPIITMIADIFPAALGGSVILETIFSIPGLGLEIYTAVISTDIPMIVAVFTLTGLLTVVGYLVSDILYAIVDPRITIK